MISIKILFGILSIVFLTLTIGGYVYCIIQAFLEPETMGYSEEDDVLNLILRTVFYLPYFAVAIPYALVKKLIRKKSH